jgi:hypothetical protein
VPRRLAGALAAFRLAFAVALLIAAGAVVAIVLGFGSTWSHLGDERRHMTDAEALRAAAVHERLPVGLFDRFKARLHRGDRWWLDLPQGPAEALAHRSDVYRAYAVFWFLPAVPADSRRDATVVFTIRHLQ